MIFKIKVDKTTENVTKLQVFVTSVQLFKGALY